MVTRPESRRLPFQDLDGSFVNLGHYLTLLDFDVVSTLGQVGVHSDQLRYDAHFG